jgi:hypothetical protein
VNRSGLVRLLVLDTICDDFESVDQVILREVAEQGHKCGLNIGRSEVVDALAGLVQDGLAKAYDLSACGRDPFSGELPGMPSLGVVKEDFNTYFYITKKGRDLQLSDDGSWPFDDNGLLRRDWKPPDE